MFMLQNTPVRFQGLTESDIFWNIRVQVKVVESLKKVWTDRQPVDMKLQTMDIASEGIMKMGK